MVDLSDNRLAVAIVAALLAASTNQWLQYKIKGIHYRKEKLLERYAELVGVASSELQRASHEVGAANNSTSADYADESFKEVIKDFYERRVTNQRELHRIVLQVKLLEKNAKLVALSDLLLSSQPYMAIALPGRHGAGNYNERLDKYIKDIQEYGNNISFLVKSVLECYKSY